MFHTYHDNLIHDFIYSMSITPGVKSLYLRLSCEVLLRCEVWMAPSSRPWLLTGLPVSEGAVLPLDQMGHWKQKQNYRWTCSRRHTHNMSCSHNFNLNSVHNIYTRHLFFCNKVLEKGQWNIQCIMWQLTTDLVFRQWIRK